MKCAQCGNSTGQNYISAVNRFFCSDICHLRFWQEQMPNLGGRWITNKDIDGVSRLEGGARKAEYNRIVLFILDNMDSTAIMLNLRYGNPPDSPK